MDTIYTKFDTKVVNTSDGKLVKTINTPKEFENCGWEWDLVRSELTLTADEIVPNWTVK